MSNKSRSRKRKQKLKDDFNLFLESSIIRIGWTKIKINGTI
jgi:hypothetical protein